MIVRILNVVAIAVDVKLLHELMRHGCDHFIDQVVDKAFGADATAKIAPDISPLLSAVCHFSAA
jgi:hypothetical protein